MDGGWGGIRTHEGREPLLVFKTSAFNHSATHPYRTRRNVSRFRGRVSSGCVSAEGNGCGPREKWGVGNRGVRGSHGPKPIRRELEELDQAEVNDLHETEGGNGASGDDTKGTSDEFCRAARHHLRPPVSSCPSL